MITKFKNVKWLTISEIGHNFVLGRRLYICGVGSIASSDSAVVLACVNKCGLMGVIPYNKISLFDRFKIKINILFFAKEKKWNMG